MRIVMHIGAHGTDGDRLVGTLLENRESLKARGVAVPQPARYRKLMQEAVNTLRGATASPATESEIVSAILDGETADTLILSNDRFLCLADRVLDEGKLYGKAFKTGWLANIFPSAEVEFAFALRDPASFIPALFEQRSQADLEFEDYLTGINPLTLSWSDAISRIRAAHPKAAMTVWCSEDTPLIWPEVIRTVAGLPGDTPIRGGYAIARELLTDAGRVALRDRLKGVTSELDRRRAVADCLSAHARPDAMEEEIDLPGWDAHLIGRLSEAYDADLPRIAAIPGVRLITP